MDHELGYVVYAYAIISKINLSYSGHRSLVMKLKPNAVEKQHVGRSLVLKAKAHN